ncbi:MAG: cell division protein FtsA, partial [Rubricoccaceae bacterium]|nr:cell division protein FtsA [Rubricoccaceae bacterium]
AIRATQAEKLAEARRKETEEQRERAEQNFRMARAAVDRLFTRVAERLEHQPRMEEILEIVGIEIKRSGYGRHLSAGVVLTGGGALIPGTPELASEILGLDARLGLPLGLGGGLVEEVSNPQYSTGVGLVLHGLRMGSSGASLLAAEVEQASSGDGFVGSSDNLVTRITDRMRGWFEEL